MLHISFFYFSAFFNSLGSLDVLPSVNVGATQGLVSRVGLGGSVQGGEAGGFLSFLPENANVGRLPGPCKKGLLLRININKYRSHLINSTKFVVYKYVTWSNSTFCKICYCNILHHVNDTKIYTTVIKFVMK